MMEILSVTMTGPVDSVHAAEPSLVAYPNIDDDLDDFLQIYFLVDAESLLDSLVRDAGIPADRRLDILIAQIRGSVRDLQVHPREWIRPDDR